MPLESALPRSRFSRLAQFGRLAGSVAFNTAAAGARELGRGRRPSVANLITGAENMAQLADRLAHMRGAAMKLGQLLSMDAGDVLPPDLAKLLARLREGADVLPASQLLPLLEAAWGPHWQRQFQYFDVHPLAAASIGQVHEAKTLDGRRLAIKVQYPGVRESIDSDLGNVSTLLRWSRLLPESIRLEPLLETARQQLHQEADYLREGRELSAYSRLIEGDERFEVPEVDWGLSTASVLTMSFMDGEPLENLRAEPPSVRDSLARALLQLSLREIFVWGRVQTDPNFANFRYQPQARRIQLLDFGALRHYEPSQLEALRTLLDACLSGQNDELEAAAISVGYLGEDKSQGYRRAVVKLLQTASEPLQPEVYDFGASELARRMSAQVLELRVEQGYGQLPPTEILFLHRKIGGLYMLFKQLDVQLPVRALCEWVLAETPNTGDESHCSDSQSRIHF